MSSGFRWHLSTISNRISRLQRSDALLRNESQSEIAMNYQQASLGNNQLQPPTLLFITSPFRKNINPINEQQHTGDNPTKLTPPHIQHIAYLIPLTGRRTAELRVPRTFTSLAQGHFINNNMPAHTDVRSHRHTLTTAKQKNESIFTPYQLLTAAGPEWSAAGYVVYSAEWTLNNICILFGGFFCVVGFFLPRWLKHTHAAATPESLIH